LGGDAREEPAPDPEPSKIGTDIPEADAIEQQQPALPDDTSDEPEAIPDDAAEADALDQNRTVPLDDDAPR
jgi:hypothetical protein